MRISPEVHRETSIRKRSFVCKKTFHPFYKTFTSPVVTGLALYWPHISSTSGQAPVIAMLKPGSMPTGNSSQNNSRRAAQANKVCIFGINLLGQLREGCDCQHKFHCQQRRKAPPGKRGPARQESPCQAREPLPGMRALPGTSVPGYQIKDLQRWGFDHHHLFNLHIANRVGYATYSQA